MNNEETKVGQEKVIGPLSDICDFTAKPKQFVWNILTVISSSIENATMAFLQILTCIILIPAGIFLWLFHGPLIFIRNFIHHYQTGKWPKNKHEQGSAVNIGTPNLLPNYKPPFNTLNRQFVKKQNMKLDTIDVNDTDMIIFFNMLSALVYESNEYHDRVLKKWGFKYFKRVLYPTSCNATVIAYPVNNTLILFIIFKGTSPLNLSEWLSDFNLLKCDSIPELRNAYNIVLPEYSELHGGFYRAFVNQVNNYKPINAFNGLLKACDDVINSYKQNNHKFDINTDLKVFMSGHSLGAGLCTIFTILLACYDQKNISDKYAGGMSKSLCMLSNGLASVYTYGNPHVCNEILSNYINDKLKEKSIPFRSFRNGNDIVSVVPITSKIIMCVMSDIATVVNKLFNISSDVLGPVARIGDYYKIGTEYRIGYNGNIIPRLKKGGNIANIIFDMIVTVVLSIQSYGKCIQTILNVCKRKPQNKNIDAIEEILQYSTITCVISSIAFPTLIGDHIPSEYVKNIYKYQQKGLKKLL